MKCNLHKTDCSIDSVFDNISECATLLKRVNDSLRERRIDDSKAIFENLVRCARIVKQCNRLFFDSRAKRSTRPGRATNWEIKAVLGLPEKFAVDRNVYTGEVDNTGRVIVYRYVQGKRVEIGRMEGPELDRLAAMNKLQVGVGNFKSASASHGFGFNYQNPNGSTSIDIANGLNALAKVASMCASIVITLGALKAGGSYLKSFAEKIAGGIKGIGQKVNSKINELKK